MTGGVKKIHYTTDFAKAYKKLPARIQKTVDRKDQLFRENPFNPSLRTHKLHGPLKGLWSFYVTRSYRVLFEFLDGQTAIFYDVGIHEIYR
jgi:addiction module RelE/StbE family toxin